jgi:hypothetical protein
VSWNCLQTWLELYTPEEPTPLAALWQDVRLPGIDVELKSHFVNKISRTDGLFRVPRILVMLERKDCGSQRPLSSGRH